MEKNIIFSPKIILFQFQVNELLRTVFKSCEINSRKITRRQI